MRAGYVQGADKGGVPVLGDVGKGQIRKGSGKESEFYWKYIAKR